jgi:hypothetical protein
MRVDFVMAGVPNVFSIDWHPANEALKPAAEVVASKEERNPRRLVTDDEALSPGMLLLHTQANLLAEFGVLSEWIMLDSLATVGPLVEVVRKPQSPQLAMQD